MNRPVGIPVVGEVMVVAVVIKSNPVNSRFLLFDYFSLSANLAKAILYNSGINQI